MPIHRSLSVSAVFLILAACTADPGPDLEPGREIACLQRQVSSMERSYRQALVACDAPTLPDLTGDAELQHLALADGHHFLIRPEADIYLKHQSTEVYTGSHIPGNTMSLPFGYLDAPSGASR